MPKPSSSLLLLIALTACGSPAPDPLEQIVVREPGQASGQASGGAQMAAVASTSNPGAAGKRAFAVCAGCHSVRSDMVSGIGPNLYGVIGRKAGSLKGFNYSKPLAASGLVWSKAELDSFLKNPAAKVPGTTMAVGPVGDSAKRAAIIDYLATHTK